MTETLVDLIRHGEPVGGRRYRGHGSDDPLSSLGWRQMWSAVGEEHPWRQIIASPLARCREFAGALASRAGLPLAVEPTLREIGMGRWEGRSHAEVMNDAPDEYEALYHDPVGCRPPGGEPLISFAERIGHAYDRVLATHGGHHLLIVAHAGVIRSLVGRALNAHPERWYRIRIDYAGVVRIRHQTYGPVVECVNRTRIPT